jgi:transglycosylase-like protein with SLT domain
VERKREAPAVVAPIVVLFRRLCRSSRPLCLGALPLCLAHLTAPPPQPVQPPLLAAAAPAEAQTPAARPNLDVENMSIHEGVSKDKPETVSLLSRVGGSEVGEEGRGGEGPGGADNGSSSSNSGDRRSNLEALRRTADLLIEVDSAFGVPRSPYGQLIYDVALHHSINPHLVAAMIRVESAFNPRAVSRKGACGLMQLLPSTARRFGLRKKKDLFDPKKNLQAGVRYLKWLTQRFGGDVEKILAAYNAGEGAVERFGGIPPYRETQAYVEKIFGLLGFTPEPPAAPGGGLGGVVAAGR